MIVSESRQLIGIRLTCGKTTPVPVSTGCDRHDHGSDESRKLCV